MSRLRQDREVDSARMRRAWGLVAIVAAVVVMAAVLVPFEPYIARYSPAEDDLPAIVHSASPYVQLRDFPTWFGSGYAGYFDNYPGWPRVGSDFVRPVQNVALFAMSLLVPALGLRAYLLADYLCLAISVVLMVQLLRRYTGVSPAVAGITAVAFGLSSVFLLSLLYGSFGTNTFALALTLASLVVLHPSETNEISGRRMLACAALQTLAVMSHETAVVGPLVAYFLIRAVSSGPPRLRRRSSSGISTQKAAKSPSGGTQLAPPRLLEAPPAPCLSAIDTRVSVPALGRSMRATAMSPHPPHWLTQRRRSEPVAAVHQSLGV